MSISIVTLPKDAWTKVLTNVTYIGSVHVVKQNPEPTDYLVTFVATGAAAPAINTTDFISFRDEFSPSNTVASDYYIKPLNYAGKVIIFT